MYWQMLERLYLIYFLCVIAVKVFIQYIGWNLPRDEIFHFCPKHDNFTLQQKRFNSLAFKITKIKQKGTITRMCIVGHELQHSFFVVNLITSLEPSSSTWKWNMTLNNKTKNTEPDWCRCKLQTMNPSQKATFNYVQVNKSLLQGVPKLHGH